MRPPAAEKDTAGTMSSADPTLFWTVTVLTISDSVSAGEREDLSGPAVVRHLTQLGYAHVVCDLVNDDRARIADRLRAHARTAQMILTTGGTGFGPRDVTPEATLDVCDRMAPGLAECMRAESAKKTRRAWLSRAVAGVAGRALIINLPGSPRGAVECLESIQDLLPHTLDLLAGHTQHG